MALALPDNGEVNNREVVGRRLTSDSGGARNFEEEDEDEYEHHGELQNGEYDEEDTEPGELALCLRMFGHDCGLWVKLNVTSCNFSFLPTKQAKHYCTGITLNAESSCHLCT